MKSLWLVVCVPALALAGLMKLAKGFCAPSKVAFDTVPLFGPAESVVTRSSSFHQAARK